MLTLIRTYVYNKINEFAHEEFILLLNLFEITQNNVWVGNYLYSILSCSSVAIIQLSMKVFLDFPLGTFARIELLIHISHTRQRIRVLKNQIRKSLSVASYFKFFSCFTLWTLSSIQLNLESWSYNWFLNQIFDNFYSLPQLM